jgi:hypothetical protein
MPVKITKIGKGKNKGKYRVSTPHGVHAKATSLKKAKAQETIINMHEAGVVPEGGWGKK